MITIGDHRYYMARWVPLGWLAGLLFAVAVCRSLPSVAGAVVGTIGGIVVALFVVAAHMVGRNGEPPFFAILAGMVWFAVAFAFGLNIVTVLLLSAGVAWIGRDRLWRGQVREPLPEMQPLVARNAFGARVFVTPPRRPGRDRWRLWCEGCGETQVGQTPEESLREAGNHHAEICRYEPQQLTTEGA